MKLKIKRMILLLILAFLINSLFCTKGVFAKSYSSSTSSSSNFRPRFLDEEENLGGSLYKYRVGAAWGLYDSSKGIRVFPQYEEILDCRMLYLVKLNGQWGVINEAGKILIPIQWDSVYNLGKFSQTNNFLSRLLLPPTYSFRIEKNGLFGWMTTDGRIVQPPTYVYLDSINDDLYSVCDTNGCGIIYSKNNNVFLPLTQKNPIYPFYFSKTWTSIVGNSKTIFSLKSGDKYALMDVTGKQISDYRYPGFKGMDHNIAYTTRSTDRYRSASSYLGLAAINEDREIISPTFENIETLSQKGFYKVRISGKWGVIAYDGEFIYPCEYGTFEINRMMNKYPNGHKFDEIDNYNYYHQKYLEAYYYIKVQGISSDEAQKVIKEIMSAKNKHEDIKVKTRELAKEFGISV